MYVYNTATHNCREVLITPNRAWGGGGRYGCHGGTSALPRAPPHPCAVAVPSLGCSIGYGYLHRVPRLSGDGRRTGFPAHGSFGKSSEGLTEVGGHVFPEERSGHHVTKTLCSSGPPLCRHPSWSRSVLRGRTTRHVLTPNRFTAHLYRSLDLSVSSPKLNRRSLVLFQIYPPSASPRPSALLPLSQLLPLEGCHHSLTSRL